MTILQDAGVKLPTMPGWYWARYAGEPNSKFPDVIEPALVRKEDGGTALIANSYRCDWGMYLDKFEWFEPLADPIWKGERQETPTPIQPGWYWSCWRAAGAVLMPYLVVGSGGKLVADDGEDFTELSELRWFGPVMR